MGKRKKVTYDETIVAFDIETTSYEDDGVKKAIVYSYCTAVEDEITIMRTADEFVSHMNELVRDKEITPSHRLVVWVHNLGYEWQFIKRLFEWDLDTVFCVGSRTNVIRAVTISGIEFRCTLALTAMSLSTVGDTVGVQKMVGDLDYTLPRHHLTPLTDEEIGYIENDVKIIVALIRDRLRNDTLATIPYTKTGYVRRAMRKATIGNPANHDYYTLMRQLTLDVDTYTAARAAFAGGYTHANGAIAGEVLSDVVAYDLSSSYPSSLTQFQYPMSPFLEIPNLDEISSEHFANIMSSMCCLIDVTFVGIDSRYSFPPISESRSLSISGQVLDNGRVWSAKSVRVLITEVDFDVITRAYDIEHTVVNRLWVALKDYIPTPFISEMLSYYRDKTRFKGVAGAEELYKAAKGNVNAIYGMTATDPFRIEFTINNDLEIDGERGDIAAVIEDHNKSKKRFLYYPWGSWVTAYSRSILLNTIFDMEDAGVTVAYCDTDSIYAVDNAAVAPIIERVNREITNRVHAAAEHHGWENDELISPLDPSGVAHPLGLFECETKTPLTAFKTLGAKRYAKEGNGKFSITVAGLSKSGARDYIESHGKFDFFDTGMVIPKENSGRIVHTYCEGEAHNYLTDYTGVTAEVFQHGYIHLEATEYHLGMSTEYENFIQFISTGRN